MAKIVDKIQKRKDIALACKSLFVEKSIQDLTISKIAQTAGIGKGSLYDYFENKEDIVFELVEILIEQSINLKKINLQSQTSSLEKLKVFFEFFHNQEEKDLREIYKHFIAISLSNPNQKITDYQNSKCSYFENWLDEIIQNGILEGELIEEATQYASIISSMCEGLFIASISSNSGSESLKDEINNSIELIYKFLRKTDENKK